MNKRIGPRVGQILSEIVWGTMGSTAKLALVTSALAGAGCSDAGFLDEASSAGGDGDSVASTEQALCQTICIPKLGCSTYCPPPPPPPPPQPQRGSVVPNFYITHVVYALPGKGSSVEYTSSTSMGTTTSTTDTFKREVKITAEANSTVLQGSGVSASTGWSGSTGETDKQEFSLKYSNGYKKPAQTDAIDHDYDEIWFLAHPKIDVAIYSSDMTGGQEKVQWRFGTQDGFVTGIPFFVYAGEVNNAMQMREGVKNTLDAWGITPDMYPTLLAADPLFTGTTPNMTMNPERYEYLSVFPYRPPFGQGDSPSTQSFSIETNNSSTTTKQYDFSYFVSLNTSIGFNFGALGTKLSVEGKWTWSCSSSKSRTNGSGEKDTLTLGQPAYGYAGPTLVHAYLDRLFHTYAFTLDYPQGETNLALNRPARQSTDLPGYGAVASRANDGNTDGNFWNGSVTHTDFGYMDTQPEAAGQWWTVDLGAEHVVNKVKIWNRTDCCSERLTSFVVLAWDSNELIWKPASNYSSEYTGGVGFFEIPINMVRTQYVMVAKTDDNYLSLAEVEVIGF